MFGLSEWMVVLIFVLLLLGGPALLRELGRLLAETREATHEVVKETQKDIRVIKTEVREAVEEAMAGPADPLRVFICSRQEELAPERALIAERLRQLEELGLTRPILFEMMASPDAPEEVYRRAVERCDVFMMIVGEDVSGPVLREHHLAVEHEKPRFYFVKSVEQRSDAAQRFLADIAATWGEFQTPEELAKKAVVALVTDLLENYRQRRLAYTDVIALLALGERLQIDRQFLEQTEEQAERERDWSRHPWEPEMIYIPAGPFIMGTRHQDIPMLVEKYGGDAKWYERETPQRIVYLLAFEIGKYPVTNREYQVFVREADHRSPGVWDGDEYPPGKGEHPVVNVSWRDAVAYCRWLSERTGRLYRLPTEAEWEKAARGADGRQYPWGNKFDPTRCNTYKDGPHSTMPVGQYPEGASLYGALDMAGNVLEWCSSLYKPYPYDAGDGRENLEAEGSRALRGGSWGDSQRDARCACRVIFYHPGDFFSDVGFRVVFPGSQPSAS